MKKNYTINFSVSPTTFWQVLVPGAILAIILGGFIGFFVVDRIIMPAMVGVDRDVVDVPAVVGMTWEQGSEEIYHCGLRPKIEAREFDAKIPRECIATQNPAAGEKAKKGRVVYVVISKGSEITIVPDVRRMDDVSAKAALRVAGLLTGGIKEVFSDEFGEKQVMAQTPDAGSSAGKGTSVDLVISKGTEPTDTEVPNIVGDALADATSAVEQAGLKIGRVEYKKSGSLAPGTIVSQSLAPGTRATLGAGVDIIISTAN